MLTEYEQNLGREVVFFCGPLTLVMMGTKITHEGSGRGMVDMMAARLRCRSGKRKSRQLSPKASQKNFTKFARYRQ
jgi:hypothetical protein